MENMPPEPFKLKIKFWGVRGSTPTAVAENLGYGGNTTCLEIKGRAGERIIIDAGTGIRKLGTELPQETVHLFLTHFHWDHLQGLPFFLPLLETGNKVHFHSFTPVEETEKRLKRLMSSPYFTLDFDAVGAEREYSTVDTAFCHGGLRVTAFPLNHPQGASGYRIEGYGASVVVATDVEHGNAELDRVLRKNAAGADVLIYDAQYTPAEYVTRCGWGHSTYAEAACAAHDAGISKLVLFHHDPNHSDAKMAEIVGCTTELFENTTAAREMETITLR